MVVMVRMHTKDTQSSRSMVVGRLVEMTLPDKHMTTSYLGLEDKKSMAFLHTKATFSGNTPGIVGVDMPEKLLLL